MGQRIFKRTETVKAQLDHGSLFEQLSKLSISKSQPSVCAPRPLRPLCSSPLTPTVPWSGRVGEATAPKLTARAPPSSRPPTAGGDGCSSRNRTNRTK